MAELYLETPLGKIYAQTEGPESAPLVLAVHGFSQRNGRHSWEPLMRPLAGAGYYVVSVDMPGWGRSTATSFDPLDPAQGVAVLAAIVTGLGREQATAVMGKSWGGALALALALAQPERVAKLILTAPAFMDFDRLPALWQPVLLAWAQDDRTIPVGMASRYEVAVPNLELVIYETGGHSAAANNSGDFAPRAVAFLNQPNLEMT